MNWTIRHQGSPRAVDGLSSAQVLEGLQDGRWEPTDEVKSDGEARWRSLEEHPQFSEAVADLEPPEPKHPEDETRLDMNPLIDVCLVLLIFFILTTTYASLQKIIEAADLGTEDAGGVQVVKDKDVEATMVRVGLLMRDDKVVVQVEGKDVASAP